MISRKALILGFVGLVFVAGGTASVLQSFGTVSGTASVERAVELYEVNYNSPIDGEGSGEYVVLKVNADSLEFADWNLTTGDSSENKNNVTGSSSFDYLALVDNKGVVTNSSEDLESAGVKVYDVGNLGLSNSGEVILLSFIPENNALVHEIDYSNSDCGGNEAYNVSESSCDSPLLEVTSQ